MRFNLGGRFETDTPIVDARNRMSGFDPYQINPVSGTLGVVKFMGLNGFRTFPYSPDWNNFGPRFGFAWKPFGSGRLVVRGGYGIFFAHPFDSGQPNTAALGFSLSAARNSPDNGITAPFYLRDGVPPTTATAGVLDDTFVPLKVGAAANTALTYYETTPPTGYAPQLKLSAQRAVPGGPITWGTALAHRPRNLPNP